MQGSSGQTVPPRGSAGALRSHPTTARASFLPVSLPAEARSWGGASSGWESGRSESWTQPCHSLGQAALGSVSVLVSKRDLSEPSILLSHFADEETVSYSLSTNDFSSAYGSAGNALLL